VQIALKPATKRLGLHRIFMRSKGRKHVIADGAFERLQVNARPYWLDTGEHHLGLAPRTGGTLKWSRWNTGGQVLRFGHPRAFHVSRPRISNQSVPLLSVTLHFRRMAGPKAIQPSREAPDRIHLRA
jgi:hypothetical protein